MNCGGMFGPLRGEGALGELEWNQGAALDLEEGGVNLVLSEKLATNGCGPRPVHAVDARRSSLKANRLLRLNLSGFFFFFGSELRDFDNSVFLWKIWENHD